LGEQYQDVPTANLILSSTVGKKLIMRMKNQIDEKKNLTKKIDVMMKTARMREKQLAVNIESRIKEQ
jgi:hypothetical protein